jgi:hypothetical protein
MLQRYVASVLYGCFICCNSYTRILQAFVRNVSYVLDVRRKCFIWMLHMFHTYVARYVSNVLVVSDMFQQSFHVASVFMFKALDGTVGVMRRASARVRARWSRRSCSRRRSPMCDTERGASSPRVRAGSRAKAGGPHMRAGSASRARRPGDAGAGNGEARDREQALASVPTSERWLFFLIFLLDGH